jgi:predicted nucleic acid-binding protein
VIVLDSSFIVAFHNERDAHHDPARGWMERFLQGEWGRGLLLEYVFLEVMTVLLVRRGIGVAARVGRLLLDAGELDFVPCSDLFTNAFQIFISQDIDHEIAGRPGQRTVVGRATPRARLSFADAAIAHAAKEYAGGQVLTFDADLGKFPGILIPSFGD